MNQIDDARNRSGLPKHIWIPALTIFVAWLAIGFFPYVIGHLFDPKRFQTAGTIGDSFGAANALFSALALLFVAISILKQLDSIRQQQESIHLQRQALEASTEELGLQRKEMTESRLQYERQSKAQLLNNYIAVNESIRQMNERFMDHSVEFMSGQSHQFFMGYGMQCEVFQRMISISSHLDHSILEQVEDYPEFALAKKRIAQMKLPLNRASKLICQLLIVQGMAQAELKNKTMHEVPVNPTLKHEIVCAQTCYADLFDVVNDRLPDFLREMVQVGQISFHLGDLTNAKDVNDVSHQVEKALTSSYQVFLGLSNLSRLDTEIENALRANEARS